MKAKSLLLLMLTAVLVGSCGLHPAQLPTLDGTSPVSQGAKAKLVVFGAEWCGECKVDLPLMQRLLNERLGAEAGLVQLELWVPTGKTPNTPPSEAGAESYRTFLHLSGKGYADGDPNKKPPRWPKFAELFPGIPKALPAAVVFRADGSIYKKFQPGADTFHPVDIVATVAEVLNK